MSKFFCDGGQTMLIGGPAKVDLVADDKPVVAARTAPGLTTLAPNTAVAGTGADLTMTATGTNFTQFSRIVFAGVDMPTTYVSATSLTCQVSPSQFVAGAAPVKVRTGTLVSPTVNFTFT